MLPPAAAGEERGESSAVASRLMLESTLLPFRTSTEAVREASAPLASLSAADISCSSSGAARGGSARAEVQLPVGLDARKVDL